jgi:hypothetical protein
MTPTEILEEIYKLPPRDQRSIKDSIGNGDFNHSPQEPMTEEEFLRLMFAKGKIGNIPDLSKLTDEDDDWEPIEVKGRPTSEIIIEDRG